MQNLPTPKDVRIRRIESRDEWLKWRKNCIGASDAGAVVDLDPFRTTLQLYYEKTGKLSHESSELTERGIDLEPGIVHALKRRHPTWHVWQPGFFYDVPALQIGCTPDAFFRTEGSSALGLAQCKLVTATGFNLHWDAGAIAPAHYALQTAVEAMLTGAQRAILAAYVIGEHTGRLHEIEVPLDTPETAAALRSFLDYAAAFWERVAANDPPPLTPDRDAALMRRLYPRELAASVDLTADPDIGQLLEDDYALGLDIREAKAAHLTALEKRRQAIRTQIKAKLGLAAAAIYGDRIITWKTMERQPSASRALRIRRLRSSCQA
jgi:predicted phage-related endonuclease